STEGAPASLATAGLWTLTRNLPPEGARTAAGAVPPDDCGAWPIVDADCEEAARELTRAMTTSVVGGGAVRGTDAPGAFAPIAPALSPGRAMDTGGGSDNPNCCRTRRFTISELSTPHFSQMNLIGARAISGVTSN